jgi:hypothetical protein
MNVCIETYFRRYIFKMDKDMVFDAESNMDTTNSFIFSTPNIIPSPEKTDDGGNITDNIFGNRSAQLSESSNCFTFAKPATFDREDNAHDSSLAEKRIVIQNKSPFLPYDIKKTTIFNQLEKNSKKKHDTKLEYSKSITCSEVPDSLLVRSIAKEYFEQFGEILKITIRPSRNTITVYYATKDAATAAINKSCFYQDHKLKIEWTTPNMLLKTKQKDFPKSQMSSILNMDDDVKEELEALRGLEYYLPDPQNFKALTVAAKAKVKKAKVVANKETFKRIVPLLTKPPIKSIKSIASVEKLQSKVEMPAISQKLKKMSSATIEELQTQVRQVGTTSEEKYKVSIAI